LDLSKPEDRKIYSEYRKQREQNFFKIKPTT